MVSHLTLLVYLGSGRQYSHGHDGCRRRPRGSQHSQPQCRQQQSHRPDHPDGHAVVSLSGAVTLGACQVEALGHISTGMAISCTHTIRILA